MTEKTNTTSSNIIKSTNLTCVVSGITKRVSKTTIAKGVKKYGSLEEYKKYYIDGAARKLLKQRVKPEEVQKKLLPKNVQSFSIDYEVLARLKLLKKAKKEEKISELTNFRYVPQPAKTFSSKKLS